MRDSVRSPVRAWRLVALLLVLGSGVPVAGQVPARMSAESAGVVAAARGFLVAFDSLRWEPFAAAWDADATVFLPDAETPHLLVGRESVLDYFRGLFDEVRGAAGPGTPTLHILPAVREFRASMLGPGTALVTFELGGEPAPGRRTMLWLWAPQAQAWRLRHLHASRLTLPQ